MSNNTPTPTPAPTDPVAPQPEPSLESLKEQVSAKSALIEAQKAQIHEFELTVANLRKEADAGKALEAQFAEARTRWEAESTEAAKRAADAADKALADFTAKLAAKDEEISALKAAAKTAEQIAAEKYGAALNAGAGTPVPGVPASDLQARWDAVKDNPAAATDFVRNLPPEEFKRVLRGEIK